MPRSRANTYKMFICRYVDLRTNKCKIYQDEDMAVSQIFFTFFFKLAIHDFYASLYIYVKKITVECTKTV